MIRIAICDDQEAICEQVEDILLKIGQACLYKIEIDVFYTGEELYKHISDDIYYDIIFLDIELNTMDGIEIGCKIREELNNENTQIIYISGDENYAMRLFKTRPLDFIIKPITYEKTFEVFQTAVKLINKKNKIFDYQVGHTTFKIPVKDIIYFEGNNRKIDVITVKQRDSFYGSLKHLFDKVKQYNFINIHKSYLVNYFHVTKFEYHQVTLSNGTILPISQKNRKKVREIQLKLERKYIC